MQKPSFAPPVDADKEYRAIEAALLETPRGRWFLAEHGRRARRLDTALLEESISRLQSSLRQPPALLGQLKSEIEELNGYIAEIRTNLLARSAPSDPVLGEKLARGEPASTVQGILSAAEDMHELAWSLQANEINPENCESIARHASLIYALSQMQAVESGRTQRCADALSTASARLNAVLDTVLHELQIDEGTGEAVHAQA